MMTDGDLRGVVLRKFYDLRHEESVIQLPEIAKIDPDQTVRLANICKQLAEHGLIHWEPLGNRHAMGGLGSIAARGVDVVEGTARAPITITFADARPSFVNHFHAPVNAVAQGNASIGSATQTVSSPTPLELADAVATIIRALPALQNLAPEVEKAATGLQSAEAELRGGRLPMGRLLRCLSVLGKAEDIIQRAPEAVQHIQTMFSQLGLS